MTRKTRVRRDAAHRAAERHGNRELRERVERFLRTRGICGLEHVRVDVEGGLVSLRGHISSPHDRWLCLNCSRRVAGVLDVIDELELEDGSTAENGC